MPRIRVFELVEAAGTVGAIGHDMTVMPGGAQKL